MEDGHQVSARWYGAGTHTPRAGSLASSLVAGPGLDGSSNGEGAGAGPAYYLAMGVGLWSGKAGSPDIRANR